MVGLSRKIGFWKIVKKEIQKILGLQIPFSPWIYLIHDFSFALVTNLKNLLLNFCMAASLLIASKWKLDFFFNSIS